jgi:pimeloyl-ACP methyl ester carboxylesterase
VKNVLSPVETTASVVTVSFDCEGCRLFGSLHRPSGPASSLGVILLNQGPIDRGGSHRIYHRWVQRLTALGVTVLRFDARGVGESEGQWAPDDESVTVAEVYGRVQQGIWKPDALAAIKFMVTDPAGPRVQRVILGGMCGGAVTALLAGAGHKAVAGVVAIGMPLTSATATHSIADLPNTVINEEAALYGRKLFRLEPWLRFLTMKTDYRTLAHVAAARVRRLLDRRDPNAPLGDDDKVNSPLFDAIKLAGQSRQPVLIVYGENDFLWHEFQEQIQRVGDDPRQRPFTLVTIPTANHTLTEEPWQLSMFQAVVEWLRPLAAGAVVHGR